MEQVFEEAKASCGSLLPQECDERRSDFEAAEKVVLSLVKDTASIEIEYHCREVGVK